MSSEMEENSKNSLFIIDVHQDMCECLAFTVHYSPPYRAQLLSLLLTLFPLTTYSFPPYYLQLLFLHANIILKMYLIDKEEVTL